MPALPQVFPDPPVAGSDLPPGVQGDVIVEVTIDEQGNVTDMKLTQGIGYGIDQKVLDVLRHWHFRPATRNGATIASQHLVHFHYHCPTSTADHRSRLLFAGWVERRFSGAREAFPGSGFEQEGRASIP